MKTVIFKIVVIIGFLMINSLNISTQAQEVTIFSDNFESPTAFIANYWTYDANSSGTECYWYGVSDAFFGGLTIPNAHSGTQMAYCAGVGYSGVALQPYYQNYMDANMQTKAGVIDLTNYQSAKIKFYYYLQGIDNREFGQVGWDDYFQVLITDPSAVNSVAVTWSNGEIATDEETSDWTYKEFQIPSQFLGDEVVVYFRFVSDYYNTDNGVWVDDFSVVGVPLLISGYVKDANSNPIAGVTLTFSNISPATVVTNSAGFYSKEIPYGYSGIATPSKGCYTFSPVSKSYSNVTTNQINQNYTGTLGTVTISGYVKDASSTGISGVTLTFTNVTPSTVVTDNAGYYSKTVPCGYSGTATPSKDCFSFSPVSKPYSNITTNQTNQNYTGTLGTVTISGYVKDASSTGISGVTLTFTNVTPSTVVTDNSGYYIKTVPCGYSGTATPSKVQCTFTPINRSYSNLTTNQSGKDYTGSCIGPTYTISGYIKDSQLNPISGVTVTFTNLTPVNTVQTDALGFYSMTVQSGYTGSATPSKVACTFTPVNRHYSNVTTNQSNQDYTGSCPISTITISGYIKDNQLSPISGVTVTFTNLTPVNTVQTDASGYYSMTVQSGYTGTATPSMGGCTFTPGNRSYSNVTTNQLNQDYSGICQISSSLPFQDCFESGGFTAGGWTTSGNAQISTLNPYEGIYCVKGEGTYTLEKIMSGITENIITIEYVMKASQDDRNCVNFNVMDPNGNLSASVFFRWTGNIEAYNGGGAANLTVLMAYNAGTWYQMKIVLNTLTKKYDVYINGVLKADDFNFYNATFSTINKFQWGSGEFDGIGWIDCVNMYGSTTGPVISGQIKDAGNNPIPGATVSFSNISPGTTLTDSLGNYSMTVPSGYSGIATPSKSCHTFIPISKTYTNVTSNQTNQNYTGTLGTLTISGYIKDAANTGISGVTITFTNVTPTTVITDNTGYYTKTVSCGYSGLAIPSKDCYTFTPLNRSYSNVSADQTNQDYSGTPGSVVISGYVKDGSNIGIAGVTLTFTNVTPSTVVTDNNGFYSKTVPCGYNGIATPSKDCYSFNPVNRTYTNVLTNQTNQDYTGSSGTVTISGYIKDGSNIGISGVTLTFTNVTPSTVVTDNSGFYTKTVPCGYTGIVTPSKDCYSFNPVNRTYTNVTTNQTNQNYTGSAGTINISGYVKNGSNNPIAGVTLTFTNVTPGTVVTDNNGFYTKTVQCGYSGVVTPSKDCYAFVPLNRTYTNIQSTQSDQNYTGTPGSITISGYVKDAGNAPISGVTVTFTNVTPGTVVTDNNGYYSKSFTCGYSGTATPSKDCYSFTPTNRTYTNIITNQSGQDYTGSSGSVTISGYVKDAGSPPMPIQGVTITFTNVTPGTVITDNAGFYTKTVPCNYSGTATPSKDNCTFTPLNRSYSNINSSQGNQDFTGNCLITPNHFVPVWSGNPLDPMTISCTQALIQSVSLGANDEIGIFDGAICVGAIKLTQPINPQNSSTFVYIPCSKDDPGTTAIDGYTVGHTITYKLWKHETQEECSQVTVTFPYAPTGQFSVFTVNETAIVSLECVNIFTQNIILSQGWNIISFYVLPVNMNMLNILQPLITAGNLVKVIDETGAIIQNMPWGWVNNIGDMAVTEGYYIKVASACTLTVSGNLAPSPTPILLAAGWNIMGYPCQNPQNALTALQPLITAGTLVKVINESGAIIQNMPWGWVNNIGDFVAGEGYYVKVNTATSITLTNPVSKSTTSENKMVTKPMHFVQPQPGNPYGPMAIAIAIAPDLFSKLRIGDEIAVYDGSLCVGGFVIDGSSSRNVIVTAWADDPLTDIVDGFVDFRQIYFRHWSKIKNTESILDVRYLLGDETFKSLGTFVGEVKDSPNGIADGASDLAFLGYNHPNPFSANTWIDYYLGRPAQVKLTIFSPIGIWIAELVNSYQEAGSYSVSFARDDLAVGIYLYRIEIKGDEHFYYEKTRRMIVK
ncbi:MAG: hypothetical protein PHP04_09340 [Bacteroidales bacterium]|nr:hypothetical protein [Bacteroidales bacterium]